MSIIHFQKKFFIFFTGFAFFYLTLIPTIHFPYTTFFKAIPIVWLLLGVFYSTVSKHIKILLISALSFSLLGDIALTLPFAKTLECGIAFFMLAHCSYIVLFFYDCSYKMRSFILFLPFLILVIFLFQFIKPYLGNMQSAVIIYMTILMIMVLTAFQTKQYSFIIAIGAVFFLASDLILAFNLFIFKVVQLDIPVMFLYYLAQFLLVCGFLFHTQKSQSNSVETRLSGLE